LRHFSAKHTLIVSLILSLIMISALAVTTFAQGDTKSDNASQGVQFKDSSKTPNELPYKQPMSGAEVIWMLVRVLFALALIIVLIYILIKFLSRKTRNFDSPRKLRIIAGIGLSPQKSLQVVEIGHKLYIIGVGQDVAVLDKVEHPTEVAELIEMLDTTALENQMMINWRDKFLSLFKKKEVTSEDLDIEDYEKLFSTQLQEATTNQKDDEQWSEENKERSNES